MELFFAQHGKAASKGEDPERPLTQEGRAETQRVGRLVAASGVGIDEIWHSGKLRARQTAELFADALAPARGVRARDDLGPTDDPAAVVEAARSAEGHVLLVGHKPFMVRLPSLLLTGDPDSLIMDVRYSALAALGETGDGWALRWYLPPHLA